MNIRYFAWLRAKVGKGAEEVSPPDDVRTVGDLMTWLAAERPGPRRSPEPAGHHQGRRQSGICGPGTSGEVGRRGRLLPAGHRRLSMRVLQP